MTQLILLPIFVCLHRQTTSVKMINGELIFNMFYCYLHSWPLGTKGTQSPRQLRVSTPYTQASLGQMCTQGSVQSFPVSLL